MCVCLAVNKKATICLKPHDDLPFRYFSSWVSFLPSFFLPRGVDIVSSVREYLDVLECVRADDVHAPTVDYTEVSRDRFIKHKPSYLIGKELVESDCGRRIR